MKQEALTARGVTEKWGSQHRGMAFNVKSHRKCCWECWELQARDSGKVKHGMCTHRKCAVVYFHARDNQRVFYKMKTWFPKIKLHLKRDKTLVKGLNNPKAKPLWRKQKLHVLTHTGEQRASLPPSNHGRLRDQSHTWNEWLSSQNILGTRSVFCI